MSSNPNGGPDHVDENGDVINPADVNDGHFQLDAYDPKDRRRLNIPEPKDMWVDDAITPAKIGPRDR